MLSDDDIIAGIVKREAGYTDNPADRGGPTNFGITLSTLASWRGYACSPSDVMKLTESEATAIYRKRYLEDSGIWKIPGPVIRACVLDAAVNHGPQRAIKLLQGVLRLKADGEIGSVTLTAIPLWDQWKCVAMYQAARARLYGEIVKDKTQLTFAGGWFNRLGELVQSLGTA